MKSLSIETSNKKIEEIFPTFLMFCQNVLEITKKNKINLVGIGNSVSAGWTAIDNNVQPWLEKLKPFLESYPIKGFDLNISSYTLAGNNSNENIYKFLSSDPTLNDVKEHFELIFDDWKDEFNGTIFENYVDKDIALQYYFDKDIKFSSYYENNALTITNFCGCTGEFLNQIYRGDNFKINGLKIIFQKEILYLEKIILLLQGLSNTSYVTIGNFPYVANRYLLFLNHLIKKINQDIENSARKYDVMYFDGYNLDLVSKFNGKIKIDNHADLKWQYTSLYNYLIFLMQQLPIELMKKENGTSIEKYKKLDFDGNMEKRIREIRKQ